MIVQIFGRKNCNATKKAERFFKERNIKFQFINLMEKGPSKGELKAMEKYFPLEEILDTEGKEYKKRNLQYYVYETETLLEENPILYKCPIVRFKTNATIGYCPEIWKKILLNSK